MPRVLARLFPAVRPAEAGRFGFFCALLGLVTLAQTVGLVGAETLFLSRHGAAALPRAFVGAALATVLASLAYAAVVGRARNDRLFAALLAGAAAALAAGAYAALRGAPAAAPALFAAFFATQAVFLNHYWTFAGDFFDTLASKRLFPLFMAGSSAGGAAGGALAAGLARAAPPEWLVAAWALGLAASALLLRAARGAIRRWGPLGDEESDESSVEGLRAAVVYARRSALGRWLVLSLGAMVLALFTSQVLYSEAFLRAFPEPAALAGFLGAFLVAANALELLVETAVTPRLIRRFGVASANLLHPLLTLASFGALAADFALAPAVAARLNREALDNAIAQPVRSLVYNALPARLRGRMRAFLEGIVVYSAMAAAGAALLALPDRVRGEARVLALCGLGAVAALVYLAAGFAVRRAYLAALVDELRRGRLDLRDVADALGGFEVTRLAALWRELLARRAPGAPAAGLELAPLLAARGLVEPLVYAATHRDADVREASLGALGRVDGDAARAALLGALGDPVPAVRVAALRALRETALRAGGGELSAARARLAHPLPAVRDRLHDPAPDVRAEAALLCGAEGHARLEAMARSRDDAEAVAALARLPASLERVALERARDPRPSVCAAALEALARIGAAARVATADVAPLVEHPAPAVRLAAVGVLGAQGTELAARALAGALDDPVRAVREAGASALARLGDRGAEAARPLLDAPGVWTVDAALCAVAGAGTPAARATLLGELRRRAREAWEHELAVHALPDPQDVPRRFLRTAHASAGARARRLAFRVLELLEGPHVVRSVQRTLRLGRPRARADALEVLSNLGDRQAAGLLALLHEGGPVEDRIREAPASAAAPRSGEDVVAAGCEAADPWIRLAATAAAAGEGGHGVMERLLALREVPIFAHLRLDQLESIQRAMREETYVQGEVVVREGEPGHELFLLLEGRVDVWSGWGGPHAKLLNQLAAVSWFGEMAVLDDETRTATAVVTQDARIATLGGDRLKELVFAMPEIAFEIFREMIARVRRAEKRLAQAGAAAERG